MVVEKKISASDNSSNKSTIFSELENIIKESKIPNALLFTGGNYSFLKESANTFAKAVNCLNPFDGPFSQIPCLECRSCKKIMADMHPDLINVLPDNQIIKISAIRNLYQLIVSKPNEAKNRAVIIGHAETMNEHAQNAFLKMLEEPPSNTFFILISENSNSMLPTIISRCRTLWFKPIEQRSENEIDNLDWASRREWLIKEIANIIANNKNDRFIRLKPLLIAEKLSSDQSLLNNYLSIIRTFLRDLAIIKHSSDKVIYHEHLPLLKNLSEKISHKKSLFYSKKLYETERRNQLNPSSTRINLECLFLKMTSREA